MSAHATNRRLALVPGASFAVSGRSPASAWRTRAFIGFRRPPAQDQQARPPRSSVPGWLQPSGDRPPARGLEIDREGRCRCGRRIRTRRHTDRRRVPRAARSGRAARTPTGRLPAGRRNYDRRPRLPNCSRVPESISDPRSRASSGSGTHPYVSVAGSCVRPRYGLTVSQGRAPAKVYLSDTDGHN